MNETLFRIFEPAVSKENIIITLIITLISSIIIGLLSGKIRNSLRDGFIGFLIMEIICIVLYFNVRNKVQSERYNQIKDTMIKISEKTIICNPININIRTWKDGMKCIEKCPKEVGYYILTCDLLEKEKDYESAATLIEMGLDFIRISPPPPPLCERLQKYYRHLNNRPQLDKDCNKIHY